MRESCGQQQANYFESLPLRAIICMLAVASYVACLYKRYGGSAWHMYTSDTNKMRDARMYNMCMYVYHMYIDKRYDTSPYVQTRHAYLYLAVRAHIYSTHGYGLSATQCKIKRVYLYVRCILVYVRRSASV